MRKLHIVVIDVVADRSSRFLYDRFSRAILVQYYGPDPGCVCG